MDRYLECLLQFQYEGASIYDGPMLVMLDIRVTLRHNDDPQKRFMTDTSNRLN